MTVFTIGYEGLNINQFISLLKINKIDKLIDIRAVPSSRKPGFSKTALKSKLNDVNLDYIHIVELGCPKDVRNQYKEDNNWQNYTVGYNCYLAQQTEAILNLIKTMKSSNCALMCFEADYNFCHRSLVANAINEYSNAHIKHIQKEDITKTKSLEDLLQYSFA